MGSHLYPGKFIYTDVILIINIVMTTTEFDTEDSTVFLYERNLF